MFDFEAAKLFNVTFFSLLLAQFEVALFTKFRMHASHYDPPAYKVSQGNRQEFLRNKLWKYVDYTSI
jgi:hypothetical protein